MCSTSIESLPDDVLRVIFLFFIDHYSLLAHALSNSTTTLRLVSQLWDAIVRCTPRLWTHLQMVFGEPAVPVPPPTVLSQWTTFSAEVPLTIDMDLSKGRDSEETRFIQYLDILSSAIHRWRSLRLHLSSESSASLASAFDRFEISRAKALTFTNITLRCGKSEKMDTIITNLARAPSLRHLRWAPCNSFIANAMTHHFPLNRLRSLYVGFYILPATIEVLRQCTSADHITLYFAHPGVEQVVPANTESIYLHNLRVFELVVMELDSPFLTLLHAPRLSVLCINFTDFQGHGSPPPNSTLPAKLKELLIRNRSLQVLILNSIPYTEITAIFRAPELQALRVLEIIYPDPNQFGGLQKVLVAEDEKNKDAVGTDPKSPPQEAKPRKPPSAPDSRKRKVICRPLLDGAIVLGWTDPKWDEEFFYIPESPSVRMCGRTMEWWRIVSKYEDREKAT
ncbi:hypothetical protein NP233_g12602 [Leucocoprinus birnbaumii]|uniref:F-box domain-containing protein n=1 Tax=Leucocoprinus birnbaumii TaxID=56174 RepID=A0AAD5VEQ5_9AGAR|nr:hypothetical protein NP233_g12602 [Leucocoprinus birnbaumii]